MAGIIGGGTGFVAALQVYDQIWADDTLLITLKLNTTPNIKWEIPIDLEGLLPIVCMASNPIGSRRFAPYGLYGKKPY